MLPIKKLIENDIAAEDYVILSLLYKRDYELLSEYTNRAKEFYKTVCQILLNKGLIKNNEGLEITSEGVKVLQLLKEEDIKLNVEYAKPVEGEYSTTQLVDEFREIFPAGSINGYPSRGDKRGCLKKMKQFRKNYPEFSPELILEATKQYIEERKRENYAYLMQAHYFIDKNKVSLLASKCEELMESGTKSNTSKNVIDL